ncbi:hypothetical protein [Allokutzneria oryzae]|uniref:Uncharacterized protein n=1 Tax=Allokutzneria oryzae TaxID=1378989 RepID=A0ABV6A202_9PSEU
MKNPAIVLLMSQRENSSQWQYTAIVDERMVSGTARSQANAKAEGLAAIQRLCAHLSGQSAEVACVVTSADRHNRARAQGARWVHAKLSTLRATGTSVQRCDVFGSR